MAANIMIGDEIEIPKRRFAASPAAAKGERVYAIGDIHGCFDLFEELIEEIARDHQDRPAAQSRLIILGDFIDRAPGSREIIRTLMRATNQSSHLCVLLGNHEAALLDSIAGDPQAQRMWLEFGGLATLDSFGIDPPRPEEDSYVFADRLMRGVTPEVVEWLRDLPFWTRSGDFYFCHAGVRPGVSLKRQAGEDLLWIRDEFTSSPRFHGAVVVHGHSIVERVEIHANRISVDTGAYRTGVMSAVGLEGSRVWTISTGRET